MQSESDEETIGSRRAPSSAHCLPPHGAWTHCFEQLAAAAWSHCHALFTVCEAHSSASPIQPIFSHAWPRVCVADAEQPAFSTLVLVAQSLWFFLASIAPSEAHDCPHAHAVNTRQHGAESPASPALADRSQSCNPTVPVHLVLAHESVLSLAHLHPRRNPQTTRARPRLQRSLWPHS
eukprot:3902407-Rhodomonas_salina.2